MQFQFISFGSNLKRLTKFITFNWTKYNFILGYRELFKLYLSILIRVFVRSKKISNFILIQYGLKNSSMFIMQIRKWILYYFNSEILYIFLYIRFLWLWQHANFLNCQTKKYCFFYEGHVLKFYIEITSAVSTV
jgi:hypothetical protein